MRCKKETCDVDHLTRHGLPACIGHRKSTGAACQASPVHGATVCSKHGAQSGLVRKRAAERVRLAKAEGEVAALLKEYDLPDAHPIEQLLYVVQLGGQMVRMLEQKVGQLGDVNDDDPYVVLLGLWADRLARHSKLALDAGVDERRVHLDAANATMMLHAFGVALRDMNLDPDQEHRFREVLAAELRTWADPLHPRPLEQADKHWRVAVPGQRD